MTGSINRRSTKCQFQFQLQFRPVKTSQFQFHPFLFNSVPIPKWIEPNPESSRRVTEKRECLVTNNLGKGSVWFPTILKRGVFGFPQSWKRECLVSNNLGKARNRWEMYVQPCLPGKWKGKEKFNSKINILIIYYFSHAYNIKTDIFIGTDSQIKSQEVQAQRQSVQVTSGDEAPADNLARRRKVYCQ